MFGVGEIIGLTTIGIGAFAGEKILNHVNKQELANTLSISVNVSAGIYVIYKVSEFLKHISVLFLF